MRKPCDIVVQIDQATISGYIVQAQKEDGHGLLFVTEMEDVTAMVEELCHYLREHKIDIRQYGIAIGRELGPEQACKAVRQCGRILREIGRKRKGKK